jgi:hypothetical protein
MNAADVNFYLNTAAEKAGEYGNPTEAIWWEDDESMRSFLPFNYQVLVREGEAYEGAWNSELQLVLEVTFRDGSKKLFRADGRYSSYAGPEFDHGLYEVQPTTRPVIYYEAVEEK